MENHLERQEQHLNNWQKLSPNIFYDDSGQRYVSAYLNGKITTSFSIQAVAKIQKAFPKLEKPFYDVLTERVKDNGFTDQRFADAVNHVIDTCEWPMPTIANFISWDKKLKIFTYDEIVKKIDMGDKTAMERYRPIKIGEVDMPMWMHVDDIKKYHFEVFKPEKNKK